jgi:hypothetical protein
LIGGNRFVASAWTRSVEQVGSTTAPENTIRPVAAFALGMLASMASAINTQPEILVPSGRAIPFTS